MKELRCPNCGGYVDSEAYVCEYCGTVFQDFTTLSFNKPTYIKIDFGGAKMIAKARLENVAIEDRSYMDSYMDVKGVHHRRRVPDITLHVDFHLIDNDGKTYKLEQRN